MTAKEMLKKGELIKTDLIDEYLYPVGLGWEDLILRDDDSFSRLSNLLDAYLLTVTMGKESINLKCLEFIYARMINVHKENPNCDYMIAFRKVIQHIQESS